MQTEIVTKAVIGKGKKSFNNKYEFTLSEESSGILGCYILNHKMNAFYENGFVRVNGSFDINVWYSYNNNTSTKVEVQKINYSEPISININEGNIVNENSEIEVSASKEPVVIDVSSSKNILNYEVAKEITVLVLGNAKIKIQTINSEEDVIDKEINTNYLG